MNAIVMKGNWNEQKGKLKKKIARLINNDWLFNVGKQDEIYGRLQIKLGKTRSEIDEIILGI
jgi:uncharacterized protein YjbJ (UPF0337 family)